MRDQIRGAENSADIQWGVASDVESLGQSPLQLEWKGKREMQVMLNPQDSHLCMERRERKYKCKAEHLCTSGGEIASVN